MESMSIWDGINRTQFYQDLNTLDQHRQGKYQKTPEIAGRLLRHLLDKASEESEGAALSAKVECQLADDFAFLASWNNLPEHVAAAAVHPKTKPKGLSVVIAANGGIEAQVQTAFQKILRAMERRAKQGERK